MKKFLIFVFASVLMFSGCTKKTEEPSVWESAYIEMASKLNSESCYNLSFGFYDIDKDGTPELFEGESVRTYGVYTVGEDEAVKLGEIFLHPYVTFTENSIFTYGGAGTGAYGGYLYTLENGDLKKKPLFNAAYMNEKWFRFFDSEDVGVKLQSGESVSEEEYNEMLEKYKVRAIEFYRLKELEAGENDLERFVTE